MKKLVIAVVMLAGCGMQPATAQGLKYLYSCEDQKLKPFIGLKGPQDLVLFGQVIEPWIMAGSDLNELNPIGAIAGLWTWNPKNSNVTLQIGPALIFSERKTAVSLVIGFSWTAR